MFSVDAVYVAVLPSVIWTDLCVKFNVIWFSYCVIPSKFSCEALAVIVNMLFKILVLLIVVVFETEDNSNLLGVNSKDSAASYSLFVSSFTVHFAFCCNWDFEMFNVSITSQSFNSLTSIVIG